jgi:hypothetical protein
LRIVSLTTLRAPSLLLRAPIVNEQVGESRKAESIVEMGVCLLPILASLTETTQGKHWRGIGVLDGFSASKSNVF